MTLVAGFKWPDAVTIYSDRLVTTDRIKYRESKVFVHESSGLFKVVLTMAGDQYSALRAQQEYFRMLDAEAGKDEISIAELALTLEQVLQKYYREHVHALPFELRRDSPFGFLVALWAKKDGCTRFFTTGRTNVVEHHDRAFDGSGGDLGRIFSTLIPHRDLDRSKCLSLFNHILLKATEFDAASGGGLDITTLYGDGRLERRYLAKASKQTKMLDNYEMLSEGLKVVLSNPSLKESELTAALQTFTEATTALWNKTKERKRSRRTPDDSVS